MKGWLNSKRNEEFDSRCQDVCQTYQLAPHRDIEGVHTVSVDEMTGIQALERIAPMIPMKPGQVERHEVEYKRHGTQSLIAGFDVVSGEVFGQLGPRRTEEDFVNFIESLLKHYDLSEERGLHLVMDNLNIHCSESMVKLIAKHLGDTQNLGVKRKHGILESMKTRTAYLSDASHRIVVHFTPKHSSWMNQIEIWFSILARKVIKRGSFRSQEELIEKIEAFIEFFNRTMAKPFRWT